MRRRVDMALRLCAGTVASKHLLQLRRSNGSRRRVGCVAEASSPAPAGAQALLADFPSEQARTLGFFAVAELALQLLTQATGEPTEHLIQELTLHIAKSLA